MRLHGLSDPFMVNLIYYHSLVSCSYLKNKQESSNNVSPFDFALKNSIHSSIFFEIEVFFLKLLFGDVLAFYTDVHTVWLF